MFSLAGIVDMDSITVGTVALLPSWCLPPPNRPSFPWVPHSDPPLSLRLSPAGGSRLTPSPWGSLRADTAQVMVVGEREQKRERGVTAAVGDCLSVTPLCRQSDRQVNIYLEREDGILCGGVWELQVPLFLPLMSVPMAARALQWGWLSLLRRRGRGSGRQTGTGLGRKSEWEKVKNVGNEETVRGYDALIMTVEKVERWWCFSWLSSLKSFSSMILDYWWRHGTSRESH